MAAFHFLAGAVVLLFGRALYWALVAVLGFLIGFDLVQDLAISDSRVIQLLVAIAVGVLAAGLAVMFQWLAFGLVGFLAGSYLVQAALVRYEIGGDNQALWILAGGALGAIIGLMLVDWAVILLSSLAGATMISDQLSVDHQTRLLILLGLTIGGVAFQRSQLKRQKLAG
jgi:hypothetical protein